jgi:hypothetical protein
VSKRATYRTALRALPDWDAYLLRESGLPGPRGNLELAQAVADEGDAALFDRYRALTADLAPTGTAEEFLAFCGVLGLGRRLAEGDLTVLPALRAHAQDPRWRLREAVAMALQRWGAVDMPALVGEMQAWARGAWLEQRAAAAALCEPSLLADARQARRVLRVLDTLTRAVARGRERRGPEFAALRQGLGYCWSVAVAALPAAGRPALERWLDSPDPDVRWIMRENLKKARLSRLDAAWVRTALERLT